MIARVDDHATLYRDSKTGVAMIADGSTGLGHTIHPSIHKTGSVTGMKMQGFWGKKDRIRRAFNFQHDIDILVRDEDERYDAILMAECNCDACRERRKLESKQQQ